MKFLMTELVLSRTPVTARLGAGTGAANNLGDAELGKAVKLVGDSRYDLAAAGDPIEGFVVALEAATLDGYTLGSVQMGDRKSVTLDGLQATPGTGVLAVGDYVNVGTPVAKDTALTEGVPAKVTKATIQPGVTVVAAVGDVNDHIEATKFMWRVVSLGSAGTGAVGTVGLIEKVR